MQNSSNSTTALQVADAAGSDELDVDTVNNAVKIYDGTTTQNYVNIGYNDGTSTGTISVNTGTLAIGNGTGSISLLGSGASTIDVGNNTLYIQTVDNGAIETGSGLFTEGGNLTFNNGSGATITGPSAGLTETVGSGPLTLSTTTSGALSLSSAGALALTGAAASTWDIGSNTLTLQSSGGGITTGAGLLLRAGYCQLLAIPMPGRLPAQPQAA